MSINLNSSTRMHDGCAMRPMKASVAAKHASKMLGLLWSRGVFFTAKITKTLSRMVNGEVVVVMIICIINTTCSVRCNCKPSSDTFPIHVRHHGMIRWSLQLRNTDFATLFAQNTYFDANYSEAAFSTLLNCCQYLIWKVYWFFDVFQVWLRKTY